MSKNQETRQVVARLRQKWNAAHSAFDPDALRMLTVLRDGYEQRGILEFKFTARTKDGNIIDVVTPGFKPQKRGHADD